MHLTGTALRLPDSSARHLFLVASGLLLSPYGRARPSVLVARLHFFRCWRIVAFGFGDRLAAVFAYKFDGSVPWLAGRHADSQIS